MEGEESYQEDRKIVGQFAVGCAQFRPKDILQKFDNFDDYVSKLKESLGHIAAIRDVDIESKSDIGNFNNGIPTPFPLLSDGDFPFLAGRLGVTLEIRLKLSIPVRKQKSILEIDDIEWESFGEIMVSISHKYSLPIISVYLDSIDCSEKASSCIILVRKFLKSEMESNINCGFTLDFIGPTPFHANFTVLFQENQDFDWEVLSKKGYHEIAIITGNCKSIIDVQEHIMRFNLSGDFDSFYYIKMLEKDIFELWSLCFSKVMEFQEERKEWSKFRIALDIFFPKFNTNDVFSEIAQFRLGEMNIKSLIRSRISDSSEIKLSPIWHFIKAEKRLFPKFDIDALSKFVEYIERRQAKNQAIFNVIIAAVFGALAGAMTKYLM